MISGTVSSTLGAGLFERVAVVFHRTFKEWWSEKIATGRKSLHGMKIFMAPVKIKSAQASAPSRDLMVWQCDALLRYWIGANSGAALFRRSQSAGFENRPVAEISAGTI